MTCMIWGYTQHHPAIKKPAFGQQNLTEIHRLDGLVLLSKNGQLPDQDISRSLNGLSGHVKLEKIQEMWALDIFERYGRRNVKWIFNIFQLCEAYAKTVS